MTYRINPDFKHEYKMHERSTNNRVKGKILYSAISTWAVLMGLIQRQNPVLVKQVFIYLHCCGCHKLHLSFIIQEDNECHNETSLDLSLIYIITKTWLCVVHDRYCWKSLIQTEVKWSVSAGGAGDDMLSWRHLEWCHLHIHRSVISTHAWPKIPWWMTPAAEPALQSGAFKHCPH